MSERPNDHSISQSATRAIDMRSPGDSRRVLMVVQNLPVPFDRRVWLEATSLTRAGYAVSVICPKAKGYDASFERLEDVDIYRYALPVEGESAVSFVAEFAWCWIATAVLMAKVAARGTGFDILHVCNPPETYWPLGWLAQRFGKAFIFDHHDLSPEMFEAKFGSSGRTARLAIRILRGLERATFRVADVVITTNESHRRVAVQRGSLGWEEVFVVRSGPDVERLSQYPPDETWRAGADYLLVYLGEICEQDGVDHLVRAMHHLTHPASAAGRNTQPLDVRCVFVGGGPHQPAIASYAESLGIADRCVFTGRVSDELLCRILSSADAAVDPDPKTPWSDKSTMNKIMEYMFFGLPIVAYDLTEHRVSASDAAVYVPFDKPSSENEAPDVRLAGAIGELLRDPQRRRAMSRYGHKRLRDRLAWEHSVPALLDAYDRVRGEHTYV